MKIRSETCRRYAVVGMVMMAIAGCTSEVQDPGITKHPRPVITTTIGMAFVPIPGGMFQMGDPARGGGKPTLHPVTVRPFYVARDCVSIAHFEAFVNEGKYEEYRTVLVEVMRSPALDPHDWIQASAPFEKMTYRCARAFAQWLSKKEGRPFEIISEAEHERVQQSGCEERPWYRRYGTAIACNWVGDPGVEQTRPYYRAPGAVFARNDFGWFPNTAVIWTRTRPYDFPGGPETDPEGAGSLLGTKRITRASNSAFRGYNKEDHAFGLLLVTPVLPQDLIAVAPSQHAVTPAAPATIASPLQAQTLTLAGGILLHLYRIPAQSCTVGRRNVSVFPSNDAPQTQVLIPQDYWLGATEVTQAQYVAVTGATNPSYWKGDDLPVHNVTMQDILRFCDRLTEQERAAGRLGAQEEYRLPTEAEWECAARAGSDARWVCGDDPATLGEYAWVDQPDGPKPVGRLRPNAWGFQDMAGNVLELTINLFEPYSGIACRDGWQYTYGGRPGFFAARGGSWRMGPLAAQTTLRRGHMVLGHTDFVGFRLACGPRNPTYVYGDADYRKMPPVEYPKERRDRRSRGTGLETLQADQSGPPATRPAP